MSIILSGLPAIVLHYVHNYASIMCQALPPLIWISVQIGYNVIIIIILFKVPKAAELIGKLNNITEADSYYRAMMMGGRLNKRLNVSTWLQRTMTLWVASTCMCRMGFSTGKGIILLELF